MRGKFSFRGRGGGNGNSTTRTVSNATSTIKSAATNASTTNASNSNTSTSTGTTTTSANTTNSKPGTKTFSSTVMTKNNNSSNTNSNTHNNQTFKNNRKRQRGGAVHKGSEREDTSTNNSNPATDTEEITTTIRPKESSSFEKNSTIITHTDTLMNKKIRTDTATSTDNHTATTNASGTKGKFQLSAFRNKISMSTEGKKEEENSNPVTSISSTVPTTGSSTTGSSSATEPNTKSISFGNRTHSISSRTNHPSSTVTTIDSTLFDPTFDPTFAEKDSLLVLSSMDLPFIEAIPHIDNDDNYLNSILPSQSNNTGDHSAVLTRSTNNTKDSINVPPLISETIPGTSNTPSKNTLDNHHLRTATTTVTTTLSSSMSLIPSSEIVTTIMKDETLTNVPFNVPSNNESSSIPPPPPPIPSSSMEPNSSTMISTVSSSPSTHRPSLVPRVPASVDYNFHITTIDEPSTVDEPKDPILALLAVVQREKERSKQYSLKLIKSLEYGLTSTHLLSPSTLTSPAIDSSTVSDTANSPEQGKRWTENSILNTNF